MAVRTLTARHLNRAVLARQLLLQRARLPLPRAVERMGGIQAQYAPAAYVALWSRLTRFDRSQLTAALNKPTVVQGTLMRGTIHVVSVDDYPFFAAGVRTARRQWWLRVSRSRGLDILPYAAIARLLRSRLAGGPLPQRDLIVALIDAGYPKGAWEGARLWLDMVRIPPSGTWEQRRADLYGLAGAWLTGAPAPSETDGLAHLVRRYLGAFGPAPLTDAAAWAGVSVDAMSEAAGSLRLTRRRLEDGTDAYDLPRAPLPDPDTPAPVRFLPTWDAVLLVHARRTGILPELYRPALFSTKNPHSVGSFLVDGAVAGTWRLDGARVVTEPFAPLPAPARRALAEEADRLAAFHR